MSRPHMTNGATAYVNSMGASCHEYRNLWISVVEREARCMKRVDQP